MASVIRTQKPNKPTETLRLCLPPQGGKTRVGRVKPALPIFEDKMKKLNVLYVAGLFDGEGSCGYWSSGKGRSRKQTAQIKMTHKSVLLQVKKFFGLGSVCPVKVKTHCKAIWLWRVHHKKARIVLKRLLPYLIVKKKEVQKVLASKTQKEKHTT